MDDISFEKAPVIELVAELRWGPIGSVPAGQVTVALGTGADEFFQRFGSEVAKAGYTQAEKVVPSGFPLLWHQVVWRFRRPGDQSTLFQVGPGLFSANALQPYKRWKDFRPTVATGVRALLGTRGAAEKDQSFSGASLRYINAFTTDLLAGKRPVPFISEVLGLKLALPASIGALVDPKGEVSFNTTILIPIANTSKVMSLVIGDGAVNTDAAAMYDVTVAEKNPIASTEADVMSSLDSSRNVIHGCFLELTAPFKELMKPVEGAHAG